MCMKQKSITRTKEEWNRLIQQCNDSGMTMKAWCEEHMISVETFYNRMNRTKKQMVLVAKCVGMHVLGDEMYRIISTHMFHQHTF